MGHFCLFSIDKNASYVSVLDPLSVWSSSSESELIRTHSMHLKLQIIGIYLNKALALAQPGMPIYFSGHVNHQLVFQKVRAGEYL
jgi:hypothetical protein